MHDDHARLGLGRGCLVPIEDSHEGLKKLFQAFHEERNVWPRSLQELVPDFLVAVPIDSNNGNSLEYRANPAGKLTDDLSTIARPDGEVKPQA